MTDIISFHFEGREFKYTFRSAKVRSAPLLILLHGHMTNPRPSKFVDPKWNVLCPIDDFGVEGFGSWYLGESGDLFWLRAMPELIKHVYSGYKIFFAGSSMGGYGSILHGSLNGAHGVYANVAQTKLLGSTYSERGMKKYFNPIFSQGNVHNFNDLKNVTSRGMPTTFFISGMRFDKVNYVEEQTYSFVQDLLAKNINFSHEVWLGKGHGLTHTFVDVAEKFSLNMDVIERNFEENKKGYVRPLNKNLNSEITGLSSVEAGKLLVDHGQWFTSKFGTAQIEHPINWHIDPFKNRSWVWLFHQFDFFKCLINYEKHNGDRRGYDIALKSAASWFAQFSDYRNSPKFAWHDHGSSNRARNMLLLRDSFIVANIPLLEETERLFSDFFAVHAHFLADDSKYSKGTNHGLEQSLTLLTLAAENLSAAWSEEYLNVALCRLEFELDQSFEADGGHTENSVHYQEFGILQLVKALGVLKKYSVLDAIMTERLKNKIDKASLAFSYMLAPNGISPAIGDTVYSNYPNILSKIPELSSYNKYLYARSAGQQGTPPLETDIILPNSGWAVLRNRWKDGNDLHLLTKSAFNSHYHRHDDDTSFVLHALGEEWVTDGGMYNYEENDPMRIHLRSHYAHSLSAPDGIEPVRNIETHGGRNRIDAHHLSDDAAWVQMISHMFAGYVSHRRIMLERSTLELRICDKLVPDCAENASVSCTSRFLVPANKTAIVEGRGVRVLGVFGTLLIYPDREPDNISIFSGQKEPELRGWQSRKFNAFEPAHCIEFHYTGGELEVVYNLSFEKN